MENNYVIKPFLTSYHIIFNKNVIGGADVSYSAIVDENGKTEAAIELLPYPDQMKAEGIVLANEDNWKTFIEFTIDSAKPETDVICDLLQTVVLNFNLLGNALEIKKRKEVYDFIVKKGTITKTLKMIKELTPFFLGQNNSFTPRIYLNDNDNFDIWSFDLDTPDDAIYREIYPALRR
jgi:hypothetical protein